MRFESNRKDRRKQAIYWDGVTINLRMEILERSKDKNVNIAERIGNNNIYKLSNNVKEKYSLDQKLRIMKRYLEENRV